MKLAKERIDKFSWFHLDRNITWNTPIQDDYYYSGYVKYFIGIRKQR